MRFEKQTLEFLKSYKKHSRGLQILFKITDTELNYHNIRFKSGSLYVYYLSEKQFEKLAGKKKLAYKNMQKIKIGRLIRNVAKNKNIIISDKAIETAGKIALIFKKEYGFKISDNAKDGYYYLNYDIPKKAFKTWSSRHRYGNMGSNCMRNKKNLKQLQYYNEIGVKVGILYNKKNNKVVARSLLWNNIEVAKTGERINGYDKIYFVKEIYRSILQIKLREHKYKSIHGRNGRKLIYHFPNKKLFAYYPYSDTFSYMAFDFSSISNKQDNTHLNTYLLGQNNLKSDFSFDCPNCYNSITPIQFILNKKRTEVVGCTNCHVMINKKLVNLKDNKYTFSEMIKLVFKRSGNKDLIIDERFDNYKK